MNIFLTILAALILAASPVFAGPPSGKVTLAWDYPSNAITPDLSFVITASTNLQAPTTNWNVVSSVSFSNCITTNFDGVNFEFRQQFQIKPGVMFFEGYASNFWGMSGSSNTASTPPLPIPIYQTITRTN
jgi:hypothetical protein